jgi:8-oxo-dGTP diphosphatase/2-hydroxy-dATP diphosphatase
MKKLLTLVIVHQENRVLLGMKKRGFGAGKWNGFGGKLHEGESLDAAAKRETLEEAMIEVTDLEKVGVLEFEFVGNSEILETHLYRATEFIGEPSETEEMRPQWFDADKIPFESMWADDPYWYDLFLAGKKFTAKFLFGEKDVVLEHSVEEKEVL